MKYLFFGVLSVFLLFSCSQEEISVPDNDAITSSRTSTNIDTLVIVTNGIATSYYYDVNADTLIGSLSMSDITTVSFIDIDGDGVDDEKQYKIPGAYLDSRSTDSGVYVRCLKAENETCADIKRIIATGNTVWTMN